MLTMPAPLNPRLFHNQQVIDAYNEAVAAYLAQQAQAQHAHTRAAKRSKHQTRRQRFDEQD
jgi:selenocysteine lyase/cysteine desulfurase